jgi:hypothetical protein
MSVPTKTCRLKKDKQERFNIKRGWYTTAWRIVDQNGVDLVQPWCRTKKEARETAKNLGYSIEGVLE